ncbi:predicted protein [Streptomyces viridosporus ATCC 14672]|uniref:Predicted protein n=1 Tax=Streptomyces viridosporus (strain ATCC 14672 / DSM 40746 / JCM 4963 / KCTC 9882 / NRRL B-12104 / FH 1290) TaxID=566461 RepID=D6A8R1_STRV1|nr:predicted protein [Streptomyces viridosporus ATCC 14672]
MPCRAQRGTQDQDWGFLGPVKAVLQGVRWCLAHPSDPLMSHEVSHGRDDPSGSRPARHAGCRCRRGPRGGAGTCAPARSPAGARGRAGRGPPGPSRDPARRQPGCGAVPALPAARLGGPPFPWAARPATTLPSQLRAHRIGLWRLRGDSPRAAGDRPGGAPRGGPSFSRDTPPGRDAGPPVPDRPSPGTPRSKFSEPPSVKRSFPGASVRSLGATPGNTRSRAGAARLRCHHRARGTSAPSSRCNRRNDRRGKQSWRVWKCR